MDIKKREKIEWLNYWIEDADKEKKRIILLGDSVTREIRKKLNFFMEGRYTVDLIAMSYNILDEMAVEEIMHFFERIPYKYTFIIYQMGAHHGYHIECADSIEDARQYQSKVFEILKTLRIYSENIIIMSPTLERCIDKDGNSVPNHNREIRIRNQILKDVSEKLNMDFFDLNRKIDYEKIEYADWCHFYEEDYEYISKLIIGYLFPEMHCASSNQIGSLVKLNKKLEECREKRIYIYGNGIRGNYIRKYIQKQGYSFDGFIVSEEYADSSGDTWQIEQIDRKNALIIVTPVDTVIWRRLEYGAYEYISLSARVRNILKLAEML